MSKSIIQKKVAQKKDTNDDDHDDDEKYLKDDYDFGKDVLKPDKKLLKVPSSADKV